MTRYAAVLFDWDGTVMDSTYSIASSIQLASADLQLPVPSIQQASWVIGLSLESALYRAVPDLTAEQMPLFLERYRHHFMQRDPHIKLFDGILPFMGELRGRQIALGVATVKVVKVWIECCSRSISALFLMLPVVQMKPAASRTRKCCINCWPN